MPFADILKNRKKQIDTEAEAPQTKPQATTTITIEHPAGATVTTAPAGKKWDDYSGEYVPVEQWKSPAEHYAEEDAQKAKKAKDDTGFKAAAPKKKMITNEDL